VVEGGRGFALSFLGRFLCLSVGDRAGFFLWLIILALSISRLPPHKFGPFFPFTVCAVAARCTLPFALRPGLSREKVRTKENHKGNKKGKRGPSPTPRPPTPRRRAWVETAAARTPAPTPAPSSTASDFLSSPRSRRSRSPHSDASLSPSSSTGTRLPTFVAERKSSTA